MNQETYLRGLTPIERENYLQTVAAKIDDCKYMKPLTDDEIAMTKDRLCDNLTKLGDYQDELDKVKDSFKLKMKPLQAENSMLLGEIRIKQRSTAGTVYHLANFEEGFMEMYNEEGEYLGNRKLLPTERHGGVFQMGMAK